MYACGGVYVCKWGSICMYVGEYMYVCMYVGKYMYMGEYMYVCVTNHFSWLTRSTSIIVVGNAQIYV